MKFEKEKIAGLYKRLITLYPQVFRERFRESMEQTFKDLCNERLNYDKTLSLNFVGWYFVETFFGITKENLLHLKERITMESNVIVKQKRSAIIGSLLALPFILTLLIALFNIEPLNHSLQAVTTVNAEDGFHLNAFGKVFLITTIFLLPLGFVVSLAPLVKGLRSGGSVLINPFNLVVSAALLIFTTTLLIGIVSEKYSCWKGICD